MNMAEVALILLGAVATLAGVGVVLVIDRAMKWKRRTDAATLLAMDPTMGNHALRVVLRELRLDLSALKDARLEDEK